jgi:hypothetical protein
MKKLAVLLVTAIALVTLLALGSYAVAGGGKSQVKTDLIGFQEPPSISTTGIGTFEAKIDDDSETIDWTLTYDTLDSPAPPLQAHVHVGQRSVNGGISVWLCSNLASPPTPPGTQPCPAVPARISGTADAGDVTGPNGQGVEPGAFDELVAAIRAGRTYANVHSSRFPGGEIRGQINDNNQRDD